MHSYAAVISDNVCVVYSNASHLKEIVTVRLFCLLLFLEVGGKVLGKGACELSMYFPVWWMVASAR